MKLQTDVAIVGCGPSGMVLARLLARCGVRCVILEQRAGLRRAPQAHVVSARTMEVFRDIGLAAQVRSAAVTQDLLRNIVWCSSLAGAELGRLSVEHLALEGRERQTVDVTNIAQNVLEPILLHEIEKDGHVRVLFSSTVVAVSQDEQRALLTAKRAETAEPITVEARYAIGADGAGSFVRRSLGIEFDGPKVIARFLSVHFQADLDRYIGHRPGPLYFTMNRQPGVMIAYDVSRTFVFMTPFHANADRLEDFTTERCLKLVRQAVGDPEAAIDVRDINTWIMSAQVAQHYRVGRVFLVGDAAHRFPPTGGLGMNTGAHDAANLAWKLAAVLHERAEPALLDSYEIERRPIAQRNAEQSVRNFRKMDQVWEALGMRPAMLTKMHWLLEGKLGSYLPRWLVRRLVAGGMQKVLRPIESLREGSQALASLRQVLQPVLFEQAEHFDFHGLDLGQHYAEGCVQSDGSQPPVPSNPVRDYIPNACPGSRLPEIDDARPAHDLDCCALTLLCFGPARPWREACAFLQAKGAPLRCVDLTAALDAGALERYRQICGVETDGALLVRPDAHVAARCRVAPSDRAGWLLETLRGLQLRPASERAGQGALATA